MQLTILAVGKIREPGLRGLLDDYYARCRKHTRLVELEVRDDAELVRQHDKRQSDRQLRLALDVRGQRQSSPDFAAYLAAEQHRGWTELCCLIGGADGLPAAILGAATARLSLSPMTFPHKLARLMLAEQLYRALSVLHHSPYAR